LKGNSLKLDDFSVALVILILGGEPYALKGARTVRERLF